MYDDFLKNVYKSIGSSVENLKDNFQDFMKKNLRAFFWKNDSLARAVP